MVTTLNTTEPAHDVRTSVTMTTEIMGPAGSGKSSLLDEWRQQDELVRPLVSCKQLASLPGCALDVLRLLPLVAAQTATRQRLGWREIKQMVRTSSWRHVVARASCKQPRVLVADQGPLYTLAWLRACGSSACRTVRFERWWHKLATDWASRLDAVVFLDAADDVLLERIRGREKDHRIKQRSSDEMLEYVNRFRDAHARLADVLSGQGGPRVFQFNTGEHSPHEMAQSLAAAVRPRVSF